MPNYGWSRYWYYWLRCIYYVSSASSFAFIHHPFFYFFLYCEFSSSTMLFNTKTLLATSAAASIFSVATASGNQYGVMTKRNGEPAAPSCTNFTPFVYAGCFIDPSTIRALLYDSPLDTQNMTVEKCVAFCKGMLTSIQSVFFETVFDIGYRQQLPLRRLGVLRRMLLWCVDQRATGTQRFELFLPLHWRQRRGVW
jgi:hypothetical protein